MAIANPVEWHGSDVDVTRLERTISDLWADLTRASALAGAVRTSIFNLVVYTDSERAAREVSDQLDHMVGRRPSRVIILVSDRLDSHCTVDASVAVACRSHPATGPLCSERLVLTARGRAADHMASIVIPLILPELPTYLWWPGQPPFRHRTFHRLLSVADQVVIDSAEFRSPGDGFADVTELCRMRQGVNDFHWGRLTPWREIIAQFFDSPGSRIYPSGIRSLSVEFGAGGDGRSTTAGTLLLLGWLASELGWIPETTLDGLATANLDLSVLDGERLVPIHVRFVDHGKRAAGKLMRVDIVAQPAGEDPARFSVERLDDLETACVNTSTHAGEQVDRVVPLGRKSDTDLLADELELAGHDKLYESVVEMAGRLAGREAWVPA